MILFFDIETISHSLISKDKYQERYADKLNFMPEFNQAFCISVGYIAADDTYKISTLFGDEKGMIQEFVDMIKNHTLSGFNIKGFDIPFIVKRAMHHSIAVPNSIKLWGRKPWELDNILDLCEVYKHTGMPASLDIVCQHL
jgi:predicted PolB exonuclease-like 3'-5' exonuclease